MSTNDITGDKIATKRITEDYRSKHAGIFGNRRPCTCGDRNTPGVIHRIDRPCFMEENQQQK